MRYSPRNFLEGANSVTASSAHASYPASNLYDGDPTKPWVAAASGVTDAALIADLDAHEGQGDYEGGFASFGTDRSSGGGSLSDEASIVHGGSKALKLTASTGIAMHALSFTARPSEVWRYSVWLRGDGTGSARMRLRNLRSGKYWVSGAWNASAGDVAARSTTSYAQSTGAVTFDDFDANQDTEIPFEVQFLCNDASQVAYVDDAFFWPAWDIVALIGHNWTTALGIEVSGSDDGSAWTVLATGTATYISAYVLRNAVEAYRYVRVRAAGTTTVQLYAGELWVGKTTEPVRDLLPSVTEHEARPVIDVTTAAGFTRRHTGVRHAPRSVTASITAMSRAQLSEYRDGLVRATRHGVDPALFVPYTGEGEVYLGRVAADLEVRRELSRFVHRLTVTVTENGFPTVTV